MKNNFELPIPATRILRKLGKDIQDARRRRRIPTLLMAERTGISRTTLGRIEKGDPSAAIGSYTAVLFVLGMLDKLGDVADATHDVTGHLLEDEQLPQRVRLPKSKDDHA